MPPAARQAPIVLKPERVLAEIPAPGVLDERGVHDLRRVSKKARAILRLAENAGRPDARRLRCAITRAMKPFAPLRDAAVVAKLAHKLSGKLTGGERAVARAIAAAPLPQHPRSWWTRQWRPIAKIQAALQRMDETPVSPPEIAAALKQSVRRVCKRARQVEPGGKFQRAHAWRKGVKLLRSQLKAAPLRSPSLLKVSEQLKQIAHCLGVAADHEALIAAVEAKAWPGDLRKPARRLIAAARKKQVRAVKQACKYWAKTEPELKVLRKP